MRLGQWLLMTALLSCATPALGKPKPRGAHTEAPSMPYLNLLNCRDGELGSVEALNLPNNYGVVMAPDGQTALLKGIRSSEATAALVSCKGGHTRTMEIHRDNYRDPAVDSSRIHPGLDQMGWYKFTPDGSRLVFAVTGHSRRPNPDPPPPYQSTTLVSKFIVIQLESFQTTTIDTLNWGFNSYDLSNTHIVFRGSEATYRADFEGEITRLTPQGARDLWTPELSPDGQWVAEILADHSYVLTNVHNPKRQTTLAESREPWQIWNFNVFSPDSTLLAYGRYRNLPVQHSRDHMLYVYDTGSQKDREVLSLRGSYTVLMKLSPDNRELLVYSFWVQPYRSSRLFCVDLDRGRVSVAPYQFESGNLYVDEHWTTAEVALDPGKGKPVPIDCANWKAVDKVVTAPDGPPQEPTLKKPPPIRPPEPPPDYPRPGRDR